MAGKGLNTLDGTNDEVYTPDLIWKAVEDCLGPIGLDPCARYDQRVEAQNYYTLDLKQPQRLPGVWYPKTDGLVGTWAGWGPVYCNPPYSQLQYPKKYQWVWKAREEADECVMLLRASVSSQWWQYGVAKESPALNLLRGRVKHVGEEYGATFEQALVYFGDRPEVFNDYFGWSWGWPIVRS